MLSFDCLVREDGDEDGEREPCRDVDVGSGGGDEYEYDNGDDDKTRRPALTKRPSQHAPQPPDWSLAAAAV